MFGPYIDNLRCGIVADTGSVYVAACEALPEAAATCCGPADGPGGSVDLVSIAQAVTVTALFMTGE